MVDALETMVKAQECRHGGCLAELNAMMAGTDPVSLDLFGLRLLKKHEPAFDDKKNLALKYIELAEAYGLGNSDFEIKTLICGETRA